MDLQVISKFQTAVECLIELSKQHSPELNTQEYFDEHVEHFFNDGTYVRKCTMDAGTAVVGKIHKYSNTTVVAKGKAIVVSTHQPARLVQAGDVYVTDPFNQNVFLVLEEFVITTTHGTHLTDLKALEELLIYPSNELMQIDLVTTLTTLKENLL